MIARASIAAACATVLAACGGNQSMLNPHGPAAASIAWLSSFLFAIVIVVYVLVLAALAWAIGRRRRDDDANTATSRRIAWTIAIATAVSGLTLVGLTAASAAAGRGLTIRGDRGAITVDVIGRQWWWDFQYRDVTPSDWFSSPNELHIPVGVPVELRTSSRDVIHSFWVPNLQGKRDLTPGITTTIWIQADTPGTYRGQCAEFCGHQHAHMSFVVVAEPQGQFLSWLGRQRSGRQALADGEVRRGEQLFMSSSCVLCHAVRGTGAGSRLGPDLTHVASRQTIAAGTLPNTRENLQAWIANPGRFKPGTRMPPSPLGGDDLQAVVSYVRSLR